MKSRALQVQELIRIRDQLAAAIEALRNKIAGLQIAINLVSDEPGLPGTSSPHAAKVGVSDTIKCLLRDAGKSGLKPRDVIDLAARNGTSLNRRSVYTLLNRMERTGVVVHEEGRYKLAEFDAMTGGHRSRDAPDGAMVL
jgi:hypothetical protein